MMVDLSVTETPATAPVIGAPLTRPVGISTPPHAVVGYRADGRPIFPIAGGAPDDEPDVDIDDDPAPDRDPGPDPDVDDDLDDDPPAPAARPKPVAPKKPGVADPDDEPASAADTWTPPSRDEHDRMRRTLAARKQEKLDLQRQLNELRAKSAEAETESEKAVREAAERGERKYKQPLVRTAAKAALIQAGALASVDGDKAKGEARLGRLLKLVDMDELSIDEESGEVLGLDEQIEAMRADYPELFARPEPVKRPTARPTAGPKAAAPEKPKSSWEQHASAALRQS